MNEFEYIEMYATKEQLEELKQIKQRITNVFQNINSKHNLEFGEQHLLIKSLESYLCSPYIDVDAYYIR